LLFAGVILASCDAKRLKRQIEERYPSQFGNQFFGNQQPQFFEFPNQNQRPQQFNQNQNQLGRPQFNQNGQQQQQFNPNAQQFYPNGQQTQRNPNTQQQQATQATPTQPPTTLAPAVENCRDGCTSRTTAEYVIT
jgi:Tfp pilus assembly protein FimT